MLDVAPADFPPFPGGPMCNRCGEKRPKTMRVSPRGRAFSSYYCNDPEWGHDCWTHVAALLKVITGDTYA